jgi:surfeit locus 1 family protein
VTPLLLARGGGAVLVDRGWLPAPDAATARPQDHPDSGLVRVLGMGAMLAHGAGGPAPRVLEDDTVTVWSAMRLDVDSMRRRVPYSLAAFGVVALPDQGAPAQPVREPPRPYDETMHVSYAIQWFTFAAILLVGPLFLARARRASRGAVVPPPPEV